MKAKFTRTQESTPVEKILKLVHDFAYAETIIILAVYLTIGYIIDPDDICILNGDVSFILILLSIITLFHGFENGILGVSLIALAMWLFYESFAYVEFLVTLLMTMIFSEFHYYWTQKINKAEIDADYRGAKLDELSKAFYTLKISHDQLEKNYVVKPMSIRNSIEEIIHQNRETDENDEIIDKNSDYYSNFLGLLEKSFNVQSSIIIYKKEGMSSELFSAKSTNVVLGSYTEDIDVKSVHKDYLIDKVIDRQIAVYVSDESGEPSATRDTDSDFIAAIPSDIEGELVAILGIKRMPFMSFNREILTSISILLEYFSIEIAKTDLLEKSDTLTIITDRDFRFEYSRLRHLYLKFKVDSIILVLRIDNELQATRVHERIIKMLRSLDMVTMVKENDLYYIILMFPLHDKAAALGFHNRLLFTLSEEKDKNFNFMTFSMNQNELLNKYLREDYGR